MSESCGPYHVALDLCVQDRTAVRHGVTQPGISRMGEDIRWRGILAHLRMRPSH
jgi:hypothetical protein